MRQVENQSEQHSKVGGLVAQSGLQGYSYVTPDEWKLQVSSSLLTYARVGAKAQ